MAMFSKSGEAASSEMPRISRRLCFEAKANFLDKFGKQQVRSHIRSHGKAPGNDLGDGNG
jgi:hypothetical protein